MNSTPLPSSVPEQPLLMAPLCSVFRRYLRSRNLKYTQERADILEVVMDEDGLFEADELMAAFSKRAMEVSKATLYRTIKLLKEAGIIQEVVVDAPQAHYQLVYGQQPVGAMVCMRSGERLEFSDEEATAMRNRICADHGWQPVGHRFVIYGISPD